MAYPPTTPPNNRLSTTPLTGNHDSDHNTIVDALDDIILELGTNPRGTDADIEARLDRLEQELSPVGSIIMQASDTAPDGDYLICDGAAVSRTTYATLFAKIGTTFGIGDGSTTFNVPNLEERFVAGKGFNLWADTLGETGGSKDAVVVQHSHTDNFTLPDHVHSDNFSIADESSHWHGAGTYDVDIDHNHGSTSTDGAHQHDPNSNTVHQYGTGNLGLQSGGTASPMNLRSVNVTLSDAAHAHSIPNYNVADRSVGGSSGPGSAHNHGINGSVGNPTTNPPIDGAVQNEGVSGTNANLPPYIVLNFYIRY